MPLTVAESCVRSRVGDPQKGADLLLLTPRLVGVICGVATRTGRTPLELPQGMSLARYAATLGEAALCGIDPECPLDETVERLSRQLQHDLKRVGAEQGAGYAFALVNAARREIWRVGPVQVRHEETVSSPTGGLPPSLRLAAQARALVLNALLAQTGEHDLARLKAADPSRALIAPLLAAHGSLANSTRALGYGLLNGTPVPAEHQFVQKLLPGACEVALASIGYPYLRSSLAACEHALAELLRDDPLLIERFPFIRAPKPGHESYADRAYVRVRVW